MSNIQGNKNFNISKKAKLEEGPNYSDSAKIIFAESDFFGKRYIEVASDEYVKLSSACEWARTVEHHTEFSAFLMTVSDYHGQEVTLNYDADQGREFPYLNHLKKLSDLGDKDAAYMLGIYHFSVKHWSCGELQSNLSPQLATCFFRKAWNLGHVKAKTMLGLIYHEGHWGDQVKKLAIALFEEAAKQGDLLSHLFLHNEWLNKYEALPEGGINEELQDFAKFYRTVSVKYANHFPDLNQFSNLTSIEKSFLTYHFLRAIYSDEMILNRLEESQILKWSKAILLFEIVDSPEEKYKRIMECRLKMTLDEQKKFDQFLNEVLKINEGKHEILKLC